jgi:hypothetical protein
LVDPDEFRRDLKAATTADMARLADLPQSPTCEMDALSKQPGVD